MKPVLLITIPMPEGHVPLLGEMFDVLFAPDEASLAGVKTRLHEVQFVLTNGGRGYTAQELANTPQLKLLSAQGAGYENLAVAEAKQRGIVVSNGAGTNDSIVADHALALMLSTLRRIPMLDRIMREGVWRDALSSSPGLEGKRVGIFGLGRIGEKIARRASGFNCDIGYTTRTQRDASPYAYFPDIMSLADWCDCLVLAAPGGAQTRHIVNADVLKALGAKGYLFNISRGSLVDTKALGEALRNGTIAGAGLDVYESEPAPPAELIDLDNVVLTPHVAGRSPEAEHNSLTLFMANAKRVLAGEPVSTPI